MTLSRLAVVAVGISLAVAACGGGSSYVAKVGSKPITKAQLQAVLDFGPTHYNGPAFPRPGSAEDRLVREQALDFLVQQSLAHQADAKLGIKPEDDVVTHASWLTVTGGIRISDAEVRAVFAKDPKHYQQGKRRALDLGVATEIRTELLRKKRATAMHAFVTDAEKRWPVTYATGYVPVSEMALARKVWGAAASTKACDLPAGTYSSDGSSTSCGGPNLAYCAYHSHYNDGTGQAVKYSIEPYPNCSGCSVSGWSAVQNQEHFVCHETREAVTDALGNAWFDRRGYEADDKCAWSPTPFIGTGGYSYQYEWSNANSGCVKTR